MYRSKAPSIKAAAANSLVEDLQRYFVNKLNLIASDQQSDEKKFVAVEWFRDKGVHGGGVRYVATNDQVFNRASVNVSQIHYDDEPKKSLASATALSTIIHPKNPYAPSIHMHISWTEMKSGKGYWRMMADLNPAIANQSATDLFTECLQNISADLYPLASAQGDRYFYIPAIERHRGVSHFYLEEYGSENEQVDFDLANNLGKAIIDCYLLIVDSALKNNPRPQQEDFDEQLAYHTLYLFQVLTLDRGTTSGLLVHDQNDVGIMGSLPAQIDSVLLASWQDKLATPQNLLVAEIVNVLPDTSPCYIDENVKKALANVVRRHYQSNPKALATQAQGNSIPPTVDNHK